MPFELPKIAPPKTKKELFDRMLVIMKHGAYEMPAKYKGTGAPGTYLEDLLGLTSGNKDIPDSVGWEAKFYTTQTNLIRHLQLIVAIGHLQLIVALECLMGYTPC